MKYIKQELCEFYDIVGPWGLLCITGTIAFTIFACYTQYQNELFWAAQYAK